MQDSRPTVLIIGAGFSGAITAAHLLRSARTVPLRIVIVNRSGRMARGVAYGTRSLQHVLNVPAGRMSAFASDEGDFLRFVQQRWPGAHGGSFVPRALYGEYLEHVLLSAQASAPRGTVLEHVADEAVAVEPVREGSCALVQLASGEQVLANRVVLALGNYPPSHPRLASAQAYASSRYIRDPWKPGVLEDVPTDQPVLLIGTGLTMVDVALVLAAKGRTAPMLAVSRRGLLPQPHRTHAALPPGAALPPDLLDGEPTALRILQSIRRHVATVAAAGGNWRDVIGSLRPITPDLWASLDTRERSRFLRHLRVYWDVHRHRMAPELWEKLEHLTGDGSLKVQAARIRSLVSGPASVDVELLPRRGSSLERIQVARVLNCTGPEGDVRALHDPLISQLIHSGIGRSDALGIGLDVTEDLAVVGSDDRPSEVLSLVGPLLKGTFWEATAVPELRLHAARLAARITRELASQTVTAVS